MVRACIRVLYLKNQRGKMLWRCLKLFTMLSLLANLKAHINFFPLINRIGQWRCCIVWAFKILESRILVLLISVKAIETSLPQHSHHWPWIIRVPPLIIQNLHLKFQTDWTWSVVCSVSTRPYTQSAKVDLELWPCFPKSVGFLLSSSTIYFEVWKWLGKHCSLYRVHKILYTECQSWPWTPWPKISKISMLQ